jgi:outer membrane protein
MNKITIIVESILAAAVVALFVLFFTATPQAKKADSREIIAEGELLPIAIINTDSILKHYTLAVEASEKLMSRYEESTVKLDTKAKSLQGEVETFQRDVVDFQRKLEANAFLSRERAESEQARLQKLQQDIDGLQARLSNSLQEEYQKEMNALTDTIRNFAAAYAKEKGYDFVLCKSSGIDNVLYGAPQYDVTDEVVKALNKRYAKSSEKKEKTDDKKKK